MRVQFNCGKHTYTQNYTALKMRTQANMHRAANLTYLLTQTLESYMDKSFYKTASLIAASCRSASVFRWAAFCRSRGVAVTRPIVGALAVMRPPLVVHWQLRDLLWCIGSFETCRWCIGSYKTDLWCMRSATGNRVQSVRSSI